MWDRKCWRAHHNAIFAIEWISGRDAVLTGSGDQTVRLWDVTAQQQISVFRGHTGSVKAVSARLGEPHMFSSGGRDGCISFWDMRTGTIPVAMIRDAHVPAGQAAATTKRKRWQPHSVSSLISLRVHDHALASAGASDGSVKLWDARQLANNKGRRPSPVQQLQPSLNRGNRLHGIVSLAHDPVGGRILASSTDHTVYLYDTRWCYSSHRHVPDVGQFRGHLCDSFYVKAAFSPDGRFILHGSSDRDAYIYEIARPDLPPLVLKGHHNEVRLPSCAC